MMLSRCLVSTFLIILMILIMTQSSSAGPALDINSVGEKIIKKIAGNTCGLPKINNVMKNLTLNEGDSASFHCSVDMKCMVSYIQWYHEPFNGSMKLLRTGANRGNPYSYEIKDVSYEDEGYYMCVAGNTLGETTSLAFLEIAGAGSLQQRLSVIVMLVIAQQTLQFLLHHHHHLSLFTGC